MPPMGATQVAYRNVTLRDVFGMPTTVRQGVMFENIRGRKEFHITPESFKAIEELIRWSHNVPRLAPKAMDRLAMVLAYMQMGEAQKRSAGWKRDPSDTARAWAMPVPRVTWRYFMGWRVRRMRQGLYIMTNDSREAYFIEYGIQRNPRTGEVSPRRRRRPVMKLSFRAVLTSPIIAAVSHRMITDVLYPKPGQPGTHSRQLVWQLQAPGTMGIGPNMLPGKLISPFSAANANPFARV